MSTNYTVFTNLKATGAFAAEGAVAITGNATIGGTAAVTGNTTVGGTLGVTGNTTVGGNLTVTGTLAAPGVVKLIELGDVTFEETSGEAVALYTLPEGAVLLKAYCVVTAAFNSGDSDVLILGTTATDDALMASADITEGTPATYQKDAWLVGGEGGTAINAKLTKTGAAATTGAATFYALVCCA
jgi:hypothetical protein